MNKRIIATPLWFLTGWMVGAMAAFVLDLPGFVGLVTAVTFAAAVWFDPAGWLWARQAAEAPAALSPASAATE